MFKLNIKNSVVDDLKEVKEVEEVKEVKEVKLIDSIKKDLNLIKKELEQNNFIKLNEKELEIKKNYLSDIKVDKNLKQKQIIKKDSKNSKKNKNNILTNKNAFNEALNKLTDINVTSLENRIEKENNAVDLNLLLTANDKEFKPLLTQYCNKTGKELHNVDIEHLKTLLAVHGKEKSLELLQLDACSNYSPLWLHTEPKTLNKLMYLDPCGFFVYAAGHIFHSDIIKKSNLASRPPMSQAGKESTEDNNLLDFLSDFPVQDKPTDFFTNDIPEKTSVRYFNLQDKIIGYRNLDLYHDEKDLIEVNELLRRFLGLAKPEKVANLIKFTNCFLHEITEDSNSLKLFKQELIEAIKTLFTAHFRTVKHKKSEQIKIGLDNSGRLDSNSIIAVKNKFGGLTNFHKQPAIRNQNQKESILYDLKGFWDKEVESDDLLKDFAGRGNSSKFNPNKLGLDCLTGAPLNKHKAGKGKFKLNINKGQLL